MASKDTNKEKSTTSDEGKKIDLSTLNEETLSALFKNQVVMPQYNYYGNYSFNEYIEMNPLFFSKLESLDESEKTAYLLSALGDNVFKYLKLTRSNCVLSKCKYSELVDELNEYSAETKKYASDYSKLLLINSDCSNDMNSLHKQKVAEWKSLENAISQEIPDIAKVILLFENYKEPFKSVAERYIQDNHSNIKLSDFIQHMETESLFLKELPRNYQNRGKGRRRI